jgi:sugar lactone lactonase YvrE
MEGHGAKRRRTALAATARVIRKRQLVALVLASVLWISLLSMSSSTAVASPAFVMSTVAGQATIYGSTGNGGQATSAQLMHPRTVVGDAAGNLYIGDANAHTVRKVDPSGVITAVAGDGTDGDSGDGGPATAAQLRYVTGIALDAAGNIYIADTTSEKIRKIAAGTGIISTFAGTGASGHTGDGGPASAAEIYGPQDLVIGPDGHLYFAARWSDTVRKIDLDTGMISTVAGTPFVAGSSGDGGPATAARFDSPVGISFDSSGNLFIADTANHRIRRVDAVTGIISTVAGVGTAGGSGDGGLATAAQLDAPEGIAAAIDGKLFIAETQSHRIRVVDTASGIISTFAGNGSAGFAGNNVATTETQLNEPLGLWVGFHFDLYISDSGNNIIRRAYPVDIQDADVSVSVEPSFVVSVAGHAGACNGVAQSAAASSGPTTAHLGNITSSVNAVVAQDLQVVTNAAGGYSLYLRYAGALTANGRTLTDLAASNASPGAFPAPGTEAVGYTTSDSQLTGTADRFTNGGAKWAGLSAVNAEVGHANAGFVDKTICVAFQAGAADATKAGTYTATIVYTAVPTF